MTQKQFEIYSSFRPAWRSFAVYFFGVIIFLIGPLINPQALINPTLGQFIGTLFLIFIFIKRFNNIYHINLSTISINKFFPLNQKISVPILNIQRIDLRRGLTQRLLDVAHIHIFVKNQQEPAVKLFGVPAPLRFRQLILELGGQDQRITGAWRK